MNFINYNYKQEEIVLNQLCALRNLIMRLTVNYLKKFFLVSFLNIYQSCVSFLITKHCSSMFPKEKHLLTIK